MKLSLVLSLTVFIGVSSSVSEGAWVYSPKAPSDSLWVRGVGEAVNCFHWLRGLTSSAFVERRVNKGMTDVEIIETLFDTIEIGFHNYRLHVVRWPFRRSAQLVSTDYVMEYHPELSFAPSVMAGMDKRNLRYYQVIRESHRLPIGMFRIYQWRTSEGHFLVQVDAFVTEQKGGKTFYLPLKSDLKEFQNLIF